LNGRDKSWGGNDVQPVCWKPDLLEMLTQFSVSEWSTVLELLSHSDVSVCDLQYWNCCHTQ